MSLRRTQTPLRIDELESMIRGGDFATVKKHLRSLNSKSIPRDEVVKFANLANRVDSPRFAFRLLYPIIRSEKSLVAPASGLEQIEYAEAMRRMGLVSEAYRTYSLMNLKSYPVARLRMAFCLFSQWRYREAIPILKDYLSDISPEEYSHSIAMVNLAAALVFEGLNDEALSLLAKLNVETAQKKYQLLRGNCLELTAQVHVCQASYAEAIRLLNEATELSPNGQTKYSLYQRKWRAIAECLQNGKSSAPLLHSVRQTAADSADWETVRDCDLYLAHVEQDMDLMKQVFFGTPYRTYRKRITSLTGQNFSQELCYLWNPTKNSHPRILNTEAGSIEKSELSLGSGHLMHRFLQHLTADFYKPLSLGAAFSELFPDENYAQIGSANRISQIVRRLRTWSAKNAVGFKVTELNGSFRFIIESDLALRVPESLPENSPQDHSWRLVENGVRASFFSRNDVEHQTGSSAATAKRLLRWAIDAGKVEVIGSGPGTKYRLAA